MTKRFLFTSCALAGLLLAAPAFAEESAQGNAVSFDPLSGWLIEGDASVDVSNYQYSGALAGSPYQNTGNQIYGETNAQFSKEISPYQSIKGRFNGLYNRSDYRSQYRNGSVEQFSTTWENGESAVPYVVDAGDFYASFSPRSMQLPLKGANIELQPSSSGAWSHSVNAMAGFDQSIYRQVNFDKSFFTGASYLAENDAYGSFIINHVYNYKKPDSAVSSLDLQQNVTSLGASTDMNLLGQSLSFENEVGILNGDLPGAVVTSPKTNQTDVGLFTRLEGHSKIPLTYSVLFERYGTNYQPAGGSVQSNQSHLETQIGWKFDGGLRLTGRQNRTESALETANPLTENTYGVRLTGPLLGTLVDGLTGSVDASSTHLRNESVTTHSQTYTTGLNVTKTITDDVSGRYGFRYRKLHNNITAAITEAHDHSLGADWRWTFGELSGTLSPGMVITESTTGARHSLQYGPQISANANYYGHSFNVNYQNNNTEEYVPPSNHIFSETASGRYSYTTGIHTVSLSGDYFQRYPDAAQDTHAWRVGMNYTVHFSNAPDATVAVPVEGKAATEALEVSSDELLRKPELGMTQTALLEKLKKENLSANVSNGMIVVSDDVFTRLSTPQRVVYETKNGKLVRHGVVFENTSDSSSALERDYKNILSELVRIYGRPTTNVVEGTFTETLSADLASGVVRRVHEWQLSDRTLRFGLPRHMNNNLRLELVGAATQPGINNAVWGFDRVE
ncbi:MAG: hypothetical protein SFW65_07870 [Alphaproteobacteria bacterium]|nr:hypothetical protein [Alphaproteobacteria bacterium]